MRVPMSPGIVLDHEDCPTVPDPRKQKYYRSFIAKLQFAASWIRFDISFIVASLARFCASAGPSHWAALHHLMEYIEGFPSLKLTYRRCTGVDDGLSGFADSDWGNSSSRRSTSGNLCFYNRCPILWRSKMQKTTALSTAEAEYYSASTAATEVLYLRNLLDYIRPASSYSGVRGQHCVHRVGEPRHRRTGARQAHRHSEAFRPRSNP